jgi:hypothetical protein
MLTLRRIADILADQDNLDREATRALQNRLRNLASKGFLITEEDPNATSRSARLLRPVEIARARILADAVLGNIAGDGLEAVVTALKGDPKAFPMPPSLIGAQDSRFHGHAALGVVLAGTDAGENWSLELVGQIESDGSVRWRGSVCPSDQADSETTRSEIALSLKRFFYATLPLSARVKPLIETIEKEMGH